MPLVTRQANQGNLFVQDTEPTGSWNDGDLWVDTDTGQLSVNEDGTAVSQAKITDLFSIG